ncbi:hypothetical protein STENM223S_04870 [Streptomyces tendae]
MVVGGDVDAGHVGEVVQEQAGLEVAGEGGTLGVLAGVAGGRGGPQGELLGEGHGPAVDDVPARREQAHGAEHAAAVRRGTHITGDTEVLPGAGSGGGAPGDLTGAGGQHTGDGVVGGVVDRDVGGQQIPLGLGGRGGGDPSDASRLDEIDGAQRGENGNAGVGQVLQGLIGVQVGAQERAGVQQEGEVVASGSRPGLGLPAGLFGPVAFDGQRGGVGEDPG